LFQASLVAGIEDRLSQPTNFTKDSILETFAQPEISTGNSILTPL